MQASILTLDAREASTCQEICGQVRSIGGRALLVGGCVRDGLLGLPSKDVDLEVFGVEPEALERALRKDFEVLTVGKSFGVFKIRGIDVDIAIPRRESKTGRGHKGFTIEGDPTMTVAEAAQRRDFTINAIYFDPLTGEWIDPTGGRADLAARVLRHVGPQFAEDPLRVLRAMQFIARFGLTAAPETVMACRDIEPEELPPERLFEEWRKLIVKGVAIGAGLTFLRDCGWVRYYPELAALIDCPQDPEWHPEGDVWVHTLHCMDAFAAERIGDDWEDLVVGLAVLCHDLGKPETTEFIDGRWRSHRHEALGEGPTRSFLDRLTRHRDLVEAVVPLVTHHLRPALYYKDRVNDSAIRRLAREVIRIDRLVRLASADMRGRPPIQVDRFAAGEWLMERAEALRVQDAAPKPIIKGRHLIDRGFKPGPVFKEILQTCFEAQLDGAFSDVEGGLTYLDHLLSERANATPR